MRTKKEINTGKGGKRKRTRIKRIQFWQRWITGKCDD